MRVVIAGEPPLAEDIMHLCADAGHDTAFFLVETLAHSQRALDLIDAATGADVAIECHNESKAAKRQLVKMMEGAKTIYVSALACSATEAASWATRPPTVVGWGALTPLSKEGMIEIAPALQSHPDRVEAARTFWAGLNLKTATVSDGPGLVRARVVCALINEAATALADGVASPGDIDTAMKLGTNYPRGPLEWGDLIGLDVVLGVMRGLQEEFGEDRYRPSPLLTRYVQAGWLGKKAGKGFFEYSK